MTTLSTAGREQQREVAFGSRASEFITAENKNPVVLPRDLKLFSDSQLGVFE